VKIRVRKGSLPPVVGPVNECDRFVGQLPCTADGTRALPAVSGPRSS
jgi:hypothetical protein